MPTALQSYYDPKTGQMIPMPSSNIMNSIPIENNPMPMAEGAAAPAAADAAGAATGMAGGGAAGAGAMAAGMAGSQMGGVGGSTLSGAAAGTMVMPGVGTAVGAGLGMVSGLLKSAAEKNKTEQLALAKGQTDKASALQNLAQQRSRSMATLIGALGR